MSAENDLPNVGAEEGEVEDKPDPRLFKADLYAAAAANKTEVVLQFLKNLVPPTYVDEKSSWTPLHWAAKYGNVVMMQKMIEHGATAPYHRMVRREKLRKMREDKAAEDAKKSSAGVGASGATLEGADGSAGADESKEGEKKETDKSVGNVAPAAEPSDRSVSAGTADATTHALKSKVDASDKYLDDLDEDDEDLDYDAAMERKLETSVNLLKNTPLLWAAAKGYLRPVWMLLMDGYSPNDTDDMGNNALHLAAVSGDVRVIRALVDDGAYSTKVNTYKNLPIDMSTHKECRTLIAEAMEVGASMTIADTVVKHETNVKKYSKLYQALEIAVQNTNSADGIVKLQETLRISMEAGLPEDLIRQGERVVRGLELGQELTADIDMVRAQMPIQNQQQFTTTVHKLEATLMRAREIGTDPAQIAYAEELVTTCEQEYWVSVLTNRLATVTVAQDANEHDMNRLKQAVHKGESMKINIKILSPAERLCNRLFAELGMTRALASIPVVKMPLKEGAEYPEDYWGENDTGHVVETEGFPHPPADTNEYVWEPSAAYTSLQAAITKLKASFVGAEELGANVDVCAEAKTKLLKAEKDLKVLHTKNEADKALAIENTQKLCKKKPAKAKK